MNMKNIASAILTFAAATLVYTRFSFYTTSPSRTISESTSPVLYYWTQFVGQNQISFRAIIKNAPCPEILIDERPMEMFERADLDIDEKIHICEFRGDQDLKSVKIEKENIEFAVVKPQLNKIVAFGDTGCRKKRFISQNCNNPDKWPFEKNSILAAGLKPDLAIHLGDYNYRDICPKDHAKCKALDLDIMDLWEIWESDVIRPMNSLLKSTPFIFLRGNHESCDKFGKTWFKFFGGEIENETKDLCLEAHKTIEVKIDNHNFINIDSSSEDNQRNELNSLVKKSSDEFMWFLTHRPFLAPGTDVNRKAPKLSTALLQPGALQLVMAGHTHNGSFISFKNNKPPELLLGNGGVMIDLFAGGPYERDEDSIIEKIYGHGFAAFSRIDSGSWQLQMYSSKYSSAKINCNLNQFINRKTELICK